MRDKFKEEVLEAFRKLPISERVVIKKNPFFQRLQGKEYDEMEKAIKELVESGIIEEEPSENPVLVLLKLTEKGIQELEKYKKNPLIMEEEKIIFEKFIGVTPNSNGRLGIPLKNWKEEIDADKELTLHNKFNELEENGYLNIAENKENYNLTMIELTEKGIQELGKYKKNP